MKLKCVLCGAEMGSYHDWWESLGEASYFERGLSTNRYLCARCREHKTNLLDFEADEKVIIKSEEYMKKHIEGKVSEIRNVVQGWIDGESRNYFPEMKDLVYYVEGPEAYLFVFSDRVLILSSILEGLHDKTNLNCDAVMLFPVGKNASGFVKFDDDEDNIGDAKKLNYRPDSINKYGDAHSNGFLSAISHLSGLNYKSDASTIYAFSMSENEHGVQLEKSLGDYGSLNFVYKDYEEKVFPFQFFYHQNQLMEEIYNYIQRRIVLSGQNENEVGKTEQPVQQMSSRRRKATESTQKTEKEGFSLADEISKLKGLLDCGVLTQEEFDEAKKKLIAKL